MHQVKLIDFGYASAWDAQTKYTPGTEEYISPELLRRNPGGADLRAADVWAAGILLFTLLTAPTNECDFPWTRADDSSETFRAYRDYGDLRKRPWASFSKAAKYLVLSMLMCDPTKRCTAASALAYINEHWPASKPSLLRACSVASTSSELSDSGFDSDASALTAVDELLDAPTPAPMAPMCMPPSPGGLLLEGLMHTTSYATATPPPPQPAPRKRGREEDGEDDDHEPKVNGKRKAVRRADGEH